MFSSRRFDGAHVKADGRRGIFKSGKHVFARLSHLRCRAQLSAAVAASVAVGEEERTAEELPSAAVGEEDSTAERASSTAVPFFESYTSPQRVSFCGGEIAKSWAKIFSPLIMNVSSCARPTCTTVHSLPS
jgi:hypothetical protein